MAAKPSLAHTPVAALVTLEQLLDPAYPEGWREIATCLYVQLRGRAEVAQLGDVRLAQIALALTEGLRAEIGGAQPYLSKGVDYELSLRDRQILAEYTGRNLAALARKHNITERRLRDILDVQVAEEVARRQGTLALDVPPADPLRSDF